MVRAVDSNNDWSFGFGLSNYKTGRDSLIQNLSTRLKMILGDCFFDLSEGIDYDGLRQGSRAELLALVIANRILNTDGVLKIVDYSYRVDKNRKITINYEIDSVYGRIGNTASIDI